MSSRLITFSALFVALAIGYLLGRVPMATLSAFNAGVSARAPAPSPRPAPPALPQAQAASGDSGKTSENRLHDIDAQLAELPTDDSSRLAELSSRIQLDRERLTGLRTQLSASQRELLNESMHTNSNLLAQQRIGYQSQASLLQQELSDAKVAISEQQRIVDFTFGTTPDTPPLPALRAELARRNAVAANIARQLNDLYASEAGTLAVSDSQEQARLRAWRDRQASLEGDYAATLSDLALSREAYQSLAASAAENRKKAQALTAEKNSPLPNP